MRFIYKRKLIVKTSDQNPYFPSMASPLTLLYSFSSQSLLQSLIFSLFLTSMATGSFALGSHKSRTLQALFETSTLDHNR